MADLPDDLQLPLERGEPWWYWLGGRPALEMVNTLRERWNRNVETLVTPGDLTAWLRRAGLLTGEAPANARHLADARELREAINGCVVGVLAGERCPPDALATIDHWLALALVPDRLAAPAGSAPVLTPGAPADPVDHALGLLARDAAEMIGTDQRERIRVCASSTCSARFYDRSRAGTRRWCSMQACGNVAKARRHRARGSAAGGAQRG